MAFKKEHGDNPHQIFRWTYILSAILGFWGIFGSLWLVYYEKEMNIAKWKGTLLGVAHSTIPWLVFAVLARLLPVQQWEDFAIWLLILAVFVLHFLSLLLIARRLKSKYSV